MLKFSLFACFMLAASATSPPSQTYLPPSETYLPPAPPVPHQIHQSHKTHQIPHTDNFEKHFYYFNAPEEHFEQKQIQTQFAPQSVKKNLQVIFIKPPEETHHKKAIANLIQNNAVEEKTHIYVLTPEHNHAAQLKKLQQIQQAAPVHHHKPEVHYVKYHTPAEAHNIQQNIIQQFGGNPSEFHTIGHSSGSGVGGNAPSVNFINANSNKNYHTDSENVHHTINSVPTGVDVVPGSSYLPPGLRF